MIAEAVAVNYLEIIEKLPENGILTLHGVSWEKYEKLVRDPAQSPEFTNRLRSGEDANYDAFIQA